MPETGSPGVSALTHACATGIVDSDPVPIRILCNLGLLQGFLSFRGRRYAGGRRRFASISRPKPTRELGRTAASPRHSSALVSIVANALVAEASSYLGDTEGGSWTGTSVWMCIRSG